MKIPRYIEESLQIRANSASRVVDHDYIVSNFLEKHKIEVESADYFMGVEILGDPYGSCERIRQAILNHKEE